MPVDERERSRRVIAVLGQYLSAGDETIGVFGGTAQEGMAMMRKIDLTLLGPPVPDGEIAARDLAALAGALRELTTRIARVLRFANGRVGKLDVDLPEEALADERFWEVIEGTAYDRRPDSVTESVAESAGRLLSAVTAAAPEVVFAAPKRKAVHIRGDATPSAPICATRSSPAMNSSTRPPGWPR